MQLPARVLVVIAAIVALAGCGTTEILPPIDTKDAAGLSAANQAIVARGRRYDVAVESILQGDRLLYRHQLNDSIEGDQELRLEPGVYTISYRGNCTVFGVGSTEVSDIELKPGHRYRAGMGCCNFWSQKHGCSPAWGMVYQSNSTAIFLWFEDATTGQVIDGSKSVPSLKLGIW